MQPIKIFTTGGTIDKVYFDAKSIYQVGEPNISRVLAELPLDLDYTVTSVLQKDSLEMTPADRDVVVVAVQNAAEQQIIVTHGTDTMVETAKTLQEKVQGKTIVLTGALEPALFKTSDAMFNIGCAIAAVQSLPSGTYITMNGRIFESNNVVKNVELGRFMALDEME
jgi:L-asparaginase